MGARVQRRRCKPVGAVGLVTAPEIEKQGRELEKGVVSVALGMILTNSLARVRLPPLLLTLEIMEG